MRKGLRWLILPAALVLGACPEAPSLLVPRHVDDPIDPRQACPSWRWIAVTPEPGRRAEGRGQDLPDGRHDPSGRSPECPGIRGWTEGRLFPNADESSPLSRFCLYQHPGAGNDVDVPGLVTAGHLALADRDCVAVATAGGDLEEMTWRSLRERLWREAGRSDPPPAGSPAPPIRLAVLDTQRTGGGPPVPPFRSPHGYSLAHLARDLLCDDSGDCIAQISTRLALPVVDFDPTSFAGTYRDEVRGGFVGALGDLARAIRDEVHDWQVSGPQRLVLNLSLGFEDYPQFVGTAGPDQLCENLDSSLMTAPALAVLCAVQDAVCRGALVVAAAGNRTGGPAPVTGPLLPAAWETWEGPDLDACTEVLGPAAPDPTLFPQPGATVPLIHAVGGVRADGSRIANARLHGEPRLVAYADHAVVEGHQDGRPTATYTGTSVATLVVSATAAAKWSMSPDTAAHQIVAELYDAGEDLGRPADFYRGDPPAPPSIRRIRFCRSLGQTCYGDGTPVPPPDPPLADFAPACGGEDCTVEISELGTMRPLAAPCSARTIRHREDQEPDNPCPFDQLYSAKAQPWMTPQPEQTPCPNCSAFPGGSFDLAVKIRDDWPGWPLYDPVLAIGDASYALGLDDSLGLVAGDSLLVTGIPDPALEDKSTPVVLWFRTVIGGDPVSVESPVYVARE